MDQHTSCPASAAQLQRRFEAERQELLLDGEGWALLYGESTTVRHPTYTSAVRQGRLEAGGEFIVKRVTAESPPLVAMFIDR